MLLFESEDSSSNHSLLVWPALPRSLFFVSYWQDLYHMPMPNPVLSKGSRMTTIGSASLAFPSGLKRVYRLLKFPGP